MFVREALDNHLTTKPDRRPNPIMCAKDEKRGAGRGRVLKTAKHLKTVAKQSEPTMRKSPFNMLYETAVFRGALQPLARKSTMERHP